MKRTAKVMWGALAVATVVGCAAGPNPLTDTIAEGGKPAGFLFGFWHGLICPIALVVSWFNPDVSIYEVHNTGGWYDTAFVIGAGAWGILGGHRGSKSRSKA
jgi:hypothetical protein